MEPEPAPGQPHLVSHAGDVGGEEVHAVAVEVAAGAVVVLGGAGVGVSSQKPATITAARECQPDCGHS